MKINLRHEIKQAKHKTLMFEMDVTVDAEHSIVGIFGRSGAGKTTLLKILAGIVSQAQCVMQLNGKEYENSKGRYNPFVYVGSDSPLFEHLNVAENLGLLIRHSDSRSADSFSLKEVVDLCEISSLLSQFPWQLSSGEKQRVCFARALLTGKKLLLLDEAFSALDWTMRQIMHQVLKKLVAKHGYYAVMVSHSLKELSLCVSELISIEQGLVVGQMAIDAAVEYHVENRQNTNHDNDDYFSAIKAVFSHVDEHDSSLHVWLLEALSISDKDNENICRLYIKAPARPKGETLGSELVNTLILPTQDETRTFVLDANKVSVSRHENNQTSMVNCFPVRITNIVHNETGIVLSGNWKKQVLRASITVKSFKSLSIKNGDKLYFVCKAL
ncbi:MAG: ABC-type molybdate transport system ATPase subunit [Alphaproteobacteria bacterium]|jgi:ABC-type molybdate transport system ATPase subunit